MPDRNPWGGIAAGLLICIFAALHRADSPWRQISWASLLTAGTYFGYAYSVVFPARSAWIFPRWTLQGWFLTIALALILSVFYRDQLGMGWFPSPIYPFVLLSMLIGATEEWVFRGMIQGQLSGTMPVGSIWISALLFASYKTLLFLVPDPENQSDLPLLFSLTGFAGVLLGYIRRQAGSIWPPVIAHVIFDFLVYGDSPTAPWWVWK